MAMTKRDIARKEARFYGREALRLITFFPKENEANEYLPEIVDVEIAAKLAARAGFEYLRLWRNSERAAAIGEAYRSCGMKRTRYGWE